MVPRARSAPPVLPALLLALAAAGCASGAQAQALSHGPPIAVRNAADARPGVHGGRIVRTLLLDGGQLRVDPPPARTPALSEQQAIRLVRAASAPGTAAPVSDVVVGYGTVTLTVAVHADGLLGQPSRLPAFRHRPGWFVVFEYGPHSCPSQPRKGTVPQSGTPGREPLPVELLAADGSGEGVAYSTAGSPCGGPTAPPAARPASYALSLPWTTARGSDGVLQVVATAPRCGIVDSAGTSSLPGTAATLTVGADILMVSGSCRTSAPVALPRGAAVAALRHGPTGLVRAMVTHGGPPWTGFTYDDGASHTIP